MISTTNVGSNYLCKIIEVKNLRPHPNADRLVVMSVDGNDVITSKDTPEGQISIYFPLECQINHEYLASNNEYRKSLGFNKDPDDPGGFFEEKGRVKAVRLRGQKSEGYIVPITSLAPLTGSKCKTLINYIGQEFDTIDGFLLAKKYVVPRKVSMQTGQQKLRRFESKLVDNQFRLHDDTAQLGKNLHRVQPDDIISLTWKFHGTSFVSSKILCKRKLGWRDRIARFLGVRVQDTEYDNVYSSRNVIKNEDINKEVGKGYYGSDVWGNVNSHFKDQLHCGETIYGEAVGFTSEGRALQTGYDYKCGPTEHKAYIYKITHTSYDGRVTVLGYKAMCERCIQLGVEPVPLVYYGKAGGLFNHLDDHGRPYTVEGWRDEFLEFLKVKYVHDQDSIFCNNKVPEEGVVLVVEGLKPEALKLKSFAFLEKESKELDKGEVNIEEEQEVGKE
jgi:hypothetical protein